MARKIDDIYSSLVAGLISAAAAVNIVINPLLWSIYDYKGMILYAVAIAHGIQEQLYDSLIEDVEAIAITNPPQTKQWIKKVVLDLFEYDALTVPIIQLNEDTLYPYYPNPNPSQRIIKYCSVVSGSLGRTIIKAAERVNGLPSPLNNTKKDALQSFVNTLSTPGIQYAITSNASDKIFIQVDVYYNGLYAAVIQANVISAINLYFENLDFDGIVYLSKLQDAIQSVTGVKDVVFVNVKSRQDADTVGTGQDLVLNQKEIYRSYSTVAGYIVPETTTGANWQLTDFRVGSSGLKNLNLIPE